MDTRITERFSPIHLEEMEKVRLMNRTDTKYWFHESNLDLLLLSIEPNYYLLNMDGQVVLPYETMYYDTFKNGMYNSHHNGKLNRYKIRHRSYVSSGIRFLEVKFKNNKGRTLKKRIHSDFNKGFSEKENNFLKALTPFSVEDLQPSLNNSFSRLTLVNKNFQERCTIDLNLSFTSKKKQLALHKLVIVEIKADGSSSASPLARALRDQRIKKSGFSKYCIGRSVTDTGLKRNNFKHKVRMITKTLNTIEQL